MKKLIDYFFQTWFVQFIWVTFVANINLCSYLMAFILQIQFMKLSDSEWSFLANTIYEVIR